MYSNNRKAGENETTGQFIGGNQGPVNPTFHLNLNNNLGNNVNYHNSFGNLPVNKESNDGESSSPLLPGGKPPRKPMRSYDQFATKNKAELLDPRQLLNQPQILSRRKPSDSSMSNIFWRLKFVLKFIDMPSKIFGNDNNSNNLDRSPTPVRTRAPSIVIKSQISNPIPQEVPKVNFNLDEEDANHQ